jgi:hypothetical protein
MGDGEGGREVRGGDSQCTRCTVLYTRAQT